jgi:O-antigen/teichoic acid export membrane protein
MRGAVWVGAFFALKIAVALGLLKLSANALPVAGFTVFSQLMFFASLLNVLALCGAQSGLIRQAAAAKDAAELWRTQDAAFTIWAAAAPATLLLLFCGHNVVAHMLVGDPAAWKAILALTATALAGAPGGIWCAMLTGRKRVGQSLSAQAAGLLAGSGAAAWRIMAHDPAGAALAFSAGSMVTGCAAWPFAQHLGLPLLPRLAAWPQVAGLLRFSAAFAATTGASALVAFGLRWITREHFGVTQLGYWLAASRISDLSTQLVGLFMIQVFVPHLAMIADDARRRVFLLRCWATGAGMMSFSLAVFCLASRPLIHIFLSDSYQAAATIIRICMIGDVLRVWLSLAAHTAFANGAPQRYAGMEIATLAVMAVVALALTAAGEPNALPIGYLVANAIAAVVLSVVFLKPPAQQGSISFLKKRNKKLLLVGKS